jgi:WhiB family redox-sensing transcriptional regulator
MRLETTRLTGDWRVSANCQHSEPDELFVRGAKQHDAKSVCAGCPVLAECLSHALDNRIEFGVWGGLTERQRRALLKSRPDVTDWAAYLAAQPRYDAAPDRLARHLRAA